MKQADSTSQESTTSSSSSLIEAPLNRREAARSAPTPMPKDEALDAQILDLVHQIGAAASDRKALDVRAYDVRKVVTYSDYFMICAGRSDR